MHRWLVVLLLIVLPVQFAFASVVGCYQLRSTNPALHAAQSTKLQKVVAAVDSQSTADEKTTLAIDLDHCECSACHMAGAQPGAAAGPAFVLQRHRPPAFIPAGQALDVARAIDRPNWSRAA